MEEYQVCIVAPDGHVEQRIEFRAPSDQEALKHARSMVGDDTEALVEHVIAKLKPAAP
jgi:hypothetical protein